MTDQEMEAEANYFAMCLLLPEEMLRRDVKRLFPDGFDVESDANLKALAQRYGVSLQLLILRLVDLKLVQL